MADNRQADPGLPTSAVDAGGEDIPDEMLLVRIGKGDSWAFSVLVGRHMARVVGTAWRMTGNRADGEEIAQEAFARVWVNAGKWLLAEDGGAGRFSTWLYRVVVNLCIDRKRRPRTEPMETAPEMPDEAIGAAEALERRQVSAEVAKAVAALPERQRAAVVLCVYEGVSNTEAARVMGLSVGAVESLLVRARRGLKQALSHLQDEGGDRV